MTLETLEGSDAAVPPHSAERLRLSVRLQMKFKGEAAPRPGGMEA